MSPEDKQRVAEEALAAARERRALLDVCPYPFSSEPGRHFVAVYLLALPKAALIELETARAQAASVHGATHTNPVDATVRGRG